MLADNLGQHKIEIARGGLSSVLDEQAGDGETRYGSSGQRLTRVTGLQHSERAVSRAGNGPEE